MPPKRNAPVKETNKVQEPASKRARGRPPAVPKATGAVETQKKEKGEKEVAGSVREDLQPIASALSNVPSLSASARGMILAALPHALGTALAERHAYQNQVLAEVDALLLSQKEQREATFQEAHKEQILKEAERDAALKELSVLQEATSMKKKAADEKFEEVLGAKKAIAEAKTDRVARAEAEKATQQKRELMQQERSHFETSLTEEFTTLKDGGFQSKHWRARDKASQTFLARLEPLGLDESFVSALATVFKTKIGEHGDFAKATLEHAQKYFEAYLGKLESAIAEADGLVATAADAMTEAGNVVAEKEAFAQTLEAESVLLQNEWVAEDEKRFAAAEACKGKERVLQTAAAAKARAEASLEETKSVVNSFETLKDPPLPADVSPEDPPSVDTPMTVTDPTEEPSAMAVDGMPSMVEAH